MLAPRPTPENALTEPERQHVLSVLRSEEYCDLAPAQVWARLLDDGIYLCSIRTMYRLLAIAGEMIARGWYDEAFLREWSNGPFLIREDEGRPRRILRRG